MSVLSTTPPARHGTGAMAAVYRHARRGPRRRRSAEELRRVLAAGYRIFAKHGFDEVTAGHISARDPEMHDHFWVIPYGRAFGRVRASELILVSPGGEVVRGDAAPNPGAVAIHAPIYAARPDVASIAHSHSVYGRALAALHSVLLPITQDATVFYNDNVLIPNFRGVALDVAEGRSVAAALGACHTGILANHGLLTVGDCAEAAITLFVLAEHCAQVQLIAAAAGELNPLDDAVARATHDQMERHDVGWSRFQPLYEQIVADQPDLIT